MLLDKEQIAEVAHEVNRAYCEALGDFSQPKWNNAPDWQKRSAIDGVYFHQSNPNAEPKNSHDAWLKHKKESGWVYGATKDSSKKEHPCIVPYEDLPVSERAKDFIFKAVVTSLIKI